MGSVRNKGSRLDDGEPFKEKMQRLSVTKQEQFDETEKQASIIRQNLKEVGYGS